MKTAISLPDDLFQRADAFAKRQRRSRSQVYADALAEWLARHEAQAITAALDRVEMACEGSPSPALRADGAETAAWTATGAATLAGSEWHP